VAEATRGRPRSEPARRAALEATRDLLLERGYDRTTIVAIAERAGVGKQTVYRWWPSKAAIVAECVVSGVLPFAPEVADRSGDVVTGLRRWVRRSFARLSDPDEVALFRALTSAAAAEPAPSGLEQTLMELIRAALLEVLQSAASTGVLRPGVSVDAAADLLLGAMLYRILSGASADAPDADAVLDVVLRGVLIGGG
jgi:AcrR family transcriptional regulator